MTDILDSRPETEFAPAPQPLDGVHFFERFRAPVITTEKSPFESGRWWIGEYYPQQEYVRVLLPASEGQPQSWIHNLRTGETITNDINPGHDQGRTVQEVREQLGSHGVEVGTPPKGYFEIKLLLERTIANAKPLELSEWNDTPERMQPGQPYLYVRTVQTQEGPQAFTLAFRAASVSPVRQIDDAQNGGFGVYYDSFSDVGAEGVIELNPDTLEPQRPAHVRPEHHAQRIAIIPRVPEVGVTHEFYALQEADIPTLNGLHRPEFDPSVGTSRERAVFSLEMTLQAVQCRRWSEANDSVLRDRLQHIEAQIVQAESGESDVSLDWLQACRRELCTAMAQEAREAHSQYQEAVASLVKRFGPERFVRATQHLMMEHAKRLRGRQSMQDGSWQVYAQAPPIVEECVELAAELLFEEAYILPSTLYRPGKTELQAQSLWGDAGFWQILRDNHPPIFEQMVDYLKELSFSYGQRGEGLTPIQMFMRYFPDAYAQIALGRPDFAERVHRPRHARQ